MAYRSLPFSNHLAWYRGLWCAAFLWTVWAAGNVAAAQDTFSRSSAVTSSGGNEELPPGLTTDEVAQGWISLFDGQSLYGWKAESQVDWQVVDGEIRASGGLVGLLRTTSQFGDFRLRLEFRSAADTNSGVFLRTSPQPRDPSADCYELNIAPADNPFPTGSLVGRMKTAEKFEQGTPETWHQLEGTAVGGDFTVPVDGREVLTYHDPEPLGRGYIGLQFNQGSVAFRNIALLPLGLNPLFNGSSLDGWDSSRAEATRFSVTDKGELRLQGGRGQLESAGRFGDFILQLDCRTGAANLNSGVFFRSIPGELMNGYESQIHNGMLDGNPSKPADFGTGAIFRRQPARRIVAKDEEWFTKTLIAAGPHFATWVNGYQVCDWTDNRPVHENPRNGRRLEAGTLILQGHDPGTDILFRKIRAAEIPPRRSGK